MIGQVITKMLQKKEKTFPHLHMLKDMFTASLWTIPPPPLHTEKTLHFDSSKTNKDSGLVISP